MADVGKPSRCTIVDSVVGECHCKDLFLYILKKIMHIVPATKDLIFVPTQLSILFQWQSKIVDPSISSLVHLAKGICELLPSLGIRHLSSINFSHQVSDAGSGEPLVFVIIELVFVLNIVEILLAGR